MSSDASDSGSGNSSPSSLASAATSRSSLPEEMSCEDSPKRTCTSNIPTVQEQLLLYEKKTEPKLLNSAVIPQIQKATEVLVQVISIGLNPVDWKGPKFGFGLPDLPAVLGRDFVGSIVQVAPPDLPCSAKDLDDLECDDRRFDVGDIVLGVSTDYRDSRKAAFQQYVIAERANLCRLPASAAVLTEAAPAVGVAFVTAALSLAVCLGLVLRCQSRSTSLSVKLDLASRVQCLDRSTLSEDIHEECFRKLKENDRPRRGEWIAIWGGSSTVGLFIVQLAKMAGMKVVCVANAAKRGSLLLDAGADAIVHRSSQEEAVEVLRGMMRGKKLRFGIDCVGKETAGLLQDILTDSQIPGQRCHLVGLVGTPERVTGRHDNLQHHNVPVKLFHEAPAIGTALMQWLEGLLAEPGTLILPEVNIHPRRGLRYVNEALKRLEDGDITGHRLAVPI